MGSYTNILGLPLTPLVGLASATGILWAARPAASANTGLIIKISDVGFNSLFQSDGTNWRPLNGRVLLGQATGTVAAPLGVLSLDGTEQVFVLSRNTPIPAGMIFPGAVISGEALFQRTGTAAAVTPRVGISSTSTAIGSTLSAISLSATTGLAARLTPRSGANAVNAASNLLSMTFRGTPYQSLVADSFIDATVDFSIDQFISMGVAAGAAGGAAPDTLLLFNYSFYLEA